MEGRRDGGMQGRRDGGTEGWRDGGTEGRRDGGKPAAVGRTDGGQRCWRDGQTDGGREDTITSTEKDLAFYTDNVLLTHEMLYPNRIQQTFHTGSQNS